MATARVESGYFSQLAERVNPMSRSIGAWKFSNAILGR